MELPGHSTLQSSLARHLCNVLSVLLPLEVMACTPPSMKGSKNKNKALAVSSWSVILMSMTCTSQTSFI